ncbi:hypothetical protein J2TS4_30250 [Paenibacillus sp. J2TS4]|nr:hypothetical protein J2TS4_30250 [Paenibacillus sp. J2TS4]
MKINVKRIFMAFLCAELLLFYISLIQPAPVPDHGTLLEIKPYKLQPVVQP